MDKTTVVFVLGAPGAGKGTQCSRIAERFGWTHLSTEDLLQAEIAAGSDIGQQADGIMQAGETVPTSLILDLPGSAMTGSGATLLLLDGFPHKLEQLAEFQEQCDSWHARQQYQAAPHQPHACSRASASLSPAKRVQPRWGTSARSSSGGQTEELGGGGLRQGEAQATADGRVLHQAQGPTQQRHRANLLQQQQPQIIGSA
ncbi:Adenylate kinase isoenzyme 1 [Tetrabaena socialis]|uniref:adenylate kinase n=1 Tax=Tetrabaena socialis TaxID=47790 RepID=A0A2J8A2X7_9CHLO|nr:Adenylate kinase isoenzyme 1 [Tetrabaena socialis]|eukprot:PNH06871.1 Adenylate kinase isoenzyme 1 [Tetrabaena socialis]